MVIELLILFFSLITILHYVQKSKLPDGPFSLPLIGTVGVVGIGLAGPVAEKWQHYAKMYTVFLFSKVMIVINDYKLTKELFAKEEFSGRQNAFMFHWIKGYNGNKRGIITTEGQEWSHQRRFALKELRDLGFGRKSLESVMIEEVDDVISGLLKSKNGIAEMKGTFNTAIINVLWQIVASKRFDPNASDTREMMDMLNRQFTAGPNINNFFPHFLAKLMPYSDFDNSIFAMKKMMKGFIDEHKKDIDYDQPRDFIDVYLKQIKDDPNSFNEEHLVVNCVDFFQAGAETSATTLLWAMMFIALNPQVQDKCFEEIKDVLGERCPSINDTSSMPYTMATLLEIQRMALVAESSIPHRLTKDTQVEGYKFKKGTIFVANLKKFLMDPDEFESPKLFKPERFISENGEVLKKELFVPFGIGKRICMGESLAKNELFIFFVRLLQRLEFTVTDPKPNPKQYTTGITRIPKPFLVRVTDRHL